MSQGQQYESLTIQLKHMQLSPETVTVHHNTQVTLKISKSNASAISECSSNRKFIFMIEQTDEESDPLAEGQSYVFQQILKNVGVYHLQCLNYPKIRSKIQLIKRQVEQKQQEVLEPRISISPTNMQNIVEVQEQQKQQETKQQIQDNMESSHCRSDYASYEKILSDQQIKFDALPNKYLKYFKQDFKVWRDFFDTEKQTPKITLVKQKFNSHREDNLSNHSLEFSEKQTEKEQSVISRLRSHQQISDINEEQLQHPKTMKKTNSQYGFNTDRQVQKTHMSSNSKKRPFYTTTNSPLQRTEQSEKETFVDWASNWSQEHGYEEIVLPKRGDRHLMRQWFCFLHNKFKISQFMAID